MPDVADSTGYLIDSDVLIDVLRGNKGARALLAGRVTPWAISSVSAMELIVGARDKRETAAIDAFLGACVIVPLRPSIGAAAYQLLKVYARSNGLQVFDSLVAATAMEERLTLVSRNRKHFAKIEGLRLTVPVY